MAAWRSLDDVERVPSSVFVGVRYALLLVAPFWLLVAAALWKFA